MKLEKIVFYSETVLIFLLSQVMLFKGNFVSGALLFSVFIFLILVSAKILEEKEVEK